MLTNDDFLKVLEDAFSEYINTSARSNKKLYILHGAISKDLASRLGPEYRVASLGVYNDKEETIKGRYMDKKVDITISKMGKVLGGIAVKYVMSNYGQNSNNYFENMLGETANIRCNKKAYFQIIILHKYMPYFDNNGRITKMEEIKQHHVEKYLKLSEDNPEVMMHTPTKTLFMLVDHEIHGTFEYKGDYNEFFSIRENVKIRLSDDPYSFDESVVYNDYESFINKVAHYFEYL